MTFVSHYLASVFYDTVLDFSHGLLQSILHKNLKNQFQPLKQKQISPQLRCTLSFYQYTFTVVITFNMERGSVHITHLNSLYFCFYPPSLKSFSICRRSIFLFLNKQSFIHEALFMHTSFTDHILRGQVSTYACLFPLRVTVVSNAPNSNHLAVIKSHAGCFQDFSICCCSCFSLEPLYPGSWLLNLLFSL